MPTPMQSPGTHDSLPPLWRNLSFNLMWTSTAASGFGDRMIQLAAWTMLGMQLANVQASSVQAGVTFFFFLPYVLISGFGGWLADTLPRRWVLFFCDELRGVILLIALFLVPAGGAGNLPADHHWKVYLAIFLVGCAAAVFSPTRAATIPQMVPLRQLQPANAVIMAIAIIASLLGLVVGGPIIESSLKTGLILGALAYLSTGFFFLFLKLKPHEHLPLGPKIPEWKRIFQAASYTWTHRPLFQLVALNVLFWTGSSVLVACVTAMCKVVYGVPNENIVSASGYMMATIGAGMLVSSLLIGWMNTRRESSWFMMLSLVFAALMMLALAINRSYTLGIIICFCIGFFGNAAMITTTTLIQSIAADYIRGRVFGLRDVVNTVSTVIVNLIIWKSPNADAWMIPALGVTAVVLLIIAVWGLILELTRGPMPNLTANVLWRICRLYCLVWHRLTYIGKHHIPHQGPVILAANHTTGLDPFVMQTPCNRMVCWLMLSEYQFRILGFAWRAIKPIALSKDSSDLGKIRAIIRRLQQGEIVGLFPEGALQRQVRQLKEFQPGVGMISVMGKAQIVPVWIHGTPLKHDMLWHFLTPSRTTVIFGKPFTPTKDQKHEDITAELRKRMLELAKQVEPPTPAQVGAEPK